MEENKPFKVEYTEWGEYRGTITRELDPADFEDCESVDDLRDAICEWVNSESYDDYEFTDVYDSDVCYPEEFVKEWCKMKGIEYEG